MNPSERIKAALSRPEATRRSTPTIERPAEVETTLPLLGEATRVTSSRATALESTAKVETAPPPTRDRKLGLARYAYLALTALALISVAIVLLRERLFAPKPAAPSPALQVAVQPEGTGLLSIRWNAQSLPIARAREGRLVVLEGNQQPKVVQLQPEELKIGHVFYQSSADRLEFRLEVVDAGGSVTRESVLALSGIKAATPSPEATPQLQSPAPKTQTPVTPQTKADRVAAAQVQTTPPRPNEEVAQASQPAPRTFTPPPAITTRQPEEDTRAVVLDPSGSLPGAITAPARVNLPQLNVVPPPTVRAPAPATKAAPRPVATGGNVEPAVLVTRVAPVYPVIARTARIQGTVRFTATVDRNGKLQNIQLVSGPHMLIQAATDAVKKWVYRPMMLNGQPSEVITQIEVKFALAP